MRRMSQRTLWQQKKQFCVVLSAGGSFFRALAVPFSCRSQFLLYWTKRVDKPALFVGVFGVAMFFAGAVFFCVDYPYLCMFMLSYMRVCVKELQG